MINIILVIGASGSGTSTLGKAIDEKHGFKWLDTDDYYWHITDPPFIESRPRDERVSLLRQDIEKYGRCVITGSLGVWGDEFIPLIDLVIWIDTPTQIRVERLQKREFERFGSRIQKGGDMYENHLEFIEWSKTYDTNSPPERCRALHEEWISKVSCPVVRLDGKLKINELVHEVDQALKSMLPNELKNILREYTCTRNQVGCSKAGVFCYKKDSEELYLKVSKISNEIRREKELLIWLKGKVPVPDVLFYMEEDGYTYLLMTKVPGYMACDCYPEDSGELDKVHEPIINTVKLLADAILMLQSLDIRDCPVNNTLDIKLRSALYNIENDLVDMDDWEEGNDFTSPIELYRWLINNQPNEDLTFTHGDFCLPNIFIDKDKVTGFIDTGRGGIADKWQDIALCVRSLGYNLRHTQKEQYIDLLLTHLGIEPDEEKIQYYILLDELF